MADTLTVFWIVKIVVYVGIEMSVQVRTCWTFHRISGKKRKTFCLSKSNCRRGNGFAGNNDLDIHRYIVICPVKQNIFVQKKKKEAYIVWL